jgi:SAM-dependent methyltransferase
MLSMSASDEALKQEVRSFWEREPCGSSHAEAAEGTPDYFAEVERSRAELEPFIGDYADFESAAGLRILEIGVGLGTDLVRFTRAGARMTGVDLTEHSVRLVRRRLELEGLDGALRVADAERLPFEDGAFDKVYSWGVLHHTPDSERAFREALRVLRPGGEACIMLYARRSWVAWGMWARHGPLAGRPFRSVSDVLAHHMESEGTKGYTVGELRRAFAGLEDLRVEHVGTPYDRRFAGPLTALTGRRLGWFLVVRGRKPLS